MLKRWIAIILIICVCFSCSACESLNFDDTSYFSSYTVSDVAEVESSEISVTSSTPKKENSRLSSITSSKTTEVKVTENKVKAEETVNTDKELTQPEIKEKLSIVHSYGNHNTVNTADYYQFNTLSGNKKSFYLLLDNAVKKSLSIVDIAGLNLGYDDVLAVYEKFISDFPQYFFLSKSCYLIYNSRGDKIRAFILLYTDGTVTDDFNDSLMITSVADRNVINNKINQVEAEVQNIVDNIPNDISDPLKERIIHDYIIETVEYNKAVLNSSEDLYISAPHSYDIYGALIDKSVVCEGYSKLFQYLCYRVGINATQVIGESDGSPHMWNAVKLEDEWYQVDLTWNDEEDYISYSYFNLTSDEMSKNRKIDNIVISVPDCTSTKNSFLNLFAIYVEDTNSPPTEFKTAIDNALLIKESEIYLYINNYKANSFGNVNIHRYLFYLQKHLSPSSEIGKYLAGLGIKISSELYTSNEYITIPIEY